MSCNPNKSQFNMKMLCDLPPNRLNRIEQHWANKHMELSRSILEIPQPTSNVIIRWFVIIDQDNEFNATQKRWMDFEWIGWLSYVCWCSWGPWGKLNFISMHLHTQSASHPPIHAIHVCRQRPSMGTHVTIKSLCECVSCGELSIRRMVTTTTTTNNFQNDEWCCARCDELK